MKILIVGQTASGKDYIAKKLEQYGLTSVLSRTTRPKRGDDDDSHLFVSKEQAQRETANRLAETTINGHTYYVLPEDLNDKDIYIIDPNGVHRLIEKTPDNAYLLIYVQVDKETRKQRFIQRALAHNPNQATDKLIHEFEKRNQSERQQFEQFEDEYIFNRSKHPEFSEHVPKIYGIGNELSKSEKDLDKVIAYIVEQLAFSRDVVNLVQECAKLNVFAKQEKETNKVFIAYGQSEKHMDLKAYSYEQAAGIIMNDTNGVPILKKAYTQALIQQNKE